MQIPSLLQLKRRFFEWLPENNRLERIWVFAKIDFKKRYYNNFLGLLWAFLNPLFQLVVYYSVFTLIFQRGHIEHFALYVFLGILFWMFFNEGSRKGISILKTKRYLIENIPFQKIDLYLSATFSALFGFLFNCVAFFLILIFLRIPITSTVLFFPLMIINIFLLILGITILLSTISIYVKDITHIWNLATLAGFWATPIFYDAQILKEKIPAILYLNPVAGIIINARETALYGGMPDFSLYAFNMIFAIVLLIFSIWLFNKYSHKAVENL